MNTEMMNLRVRSVALAITSIALLGSVSSARADEGKHSVQTASASSTNAANAALECSIELWDPYNDNQGTKARGRIQCDAVMRQIDVRFYIDRLNTETNQWEDYFEQLFNFDDLRDTGIINFGDRFSQYCSGDYEWEYRTRAVAWYEGPNGETWDAEWQTGWIFLYC